MTRMAVVAAIIFGLAAISGLIMAYRFLPKFRFWCFDIWADLPLVGMVARRARLRNPDTARANTRLDELFHAYLLHMPSPIEEEDFKRIRRYLFLASDSQSKPTPALAWGLLLLLICAESYAFSFLLGISLSGDMSQNRADLVAIGVAFILGLVLLILAHMSGHQLRRANELRGARRHMIDTGGEWPEKEKSRKELCQKVQLEQNQDIDEPLLENYDSQRFVNRVAKNEDDRGGYAVPVLFVFAVLLIGVGQYKLRNIMLAESAGTASSAPEWANALFVLIFFMTQGLALMFGYRYGFMGQDSERGYHIIGGRNDYSDYRQERDPMIRRADESLASLLAKMRNRYSHIKPDDLTFMERFYREEARQVREQAPPPSPPGGKAELKVVHHASETPDAAKSSGE